MSRRRISTQAELREHYGQPVDRALWKEIDHINDHYKAFIEAAPFCILATAGENGIDCSPKGDPAGFVVVASPKKLYLPDRRGNNRIDSLRNIIENPQVGLIFFIPTVGETLRVSGRAEIIIDSALCEQFAMNGKAATSVVGIDVEKAYFQCQKALVRSGLWDSATYPVERPVPTAGQITKAFAQARQNAFDDEAYDQNYPLHLKDTLY